MRGRRVRGRGGGVPSQWYRPRRRGVPARGKEGAGTGGRKPARRLPAPGKRRPEAESHPGGPAHLPALLIFHRNFACWLPRALRAWSRGAAAAAFAPRGRARPYSPSGGMGAQEGQPDPERRAGQAAVPARGRSALGAPPPCPARGPSGGGGGGRRRGPARPAARGAGPGGAGLGRARRLRAGIPRRRARPLSRAGGGGARDAARMPKSANI